MANLKGKIENFIIDVIVAILMFFCKLWNALSGFKDSEAAEIIVPAFAVVLVLGVCMHTVYGIARLML